MNVKVNADLKKTNNEAFMDDDMMDDLLEELYFDDVDERPYKKASHKRRHKNHHNARKRLDDYYEQRYLKRQDWSDIDYWSDYDLDHVDVLGHR